MSADAQILVVGSHLLHSNFDSASPVEVITKDKIELSGAGSTTEVLQGTSVTGGQGQINNAFGGYVTDGGPGANTLGLRGLGASRTLILLNGHRLSPAGTGGAVYAVDLNILPDAIVDNIEILKDGASSIYGSDAVAGVVDINTAQKLNGFTAEVYGNWTQHGGADQKKISLTGGHTGERYNISGSFEYYERSELTLGQRDWTQCQTQYVRSAPGAALGSGDLLDPKTGQPKCYPIGAAYGDGGVTINTLGTSSIAGTPAAGAIGTKFNRWRPNSAVTTGVPGFEGVGGSGNGYNIRDTFDPRALSESLYSPVKTYTGFLQGSYDLHALGDAQIYFSILGNERLSNQSGYRQLALDYSYGSPLLSVLPAAFQNSVFAYPNALTQYNNYVGVRAFIGAGNFTSSQRDDFWRIDGGIKGSLGITDWHYDLYVGDSWSDARNSYQGFLVDRLGQSLNVNQNADGSFSCADPSGGCVAAPAPTASVIGGNLPKSWLNYVVQDINDHTTFRETTAELSATGTLLSLPYGKVRTAVGFEYIDQTYADTPSPYSVSNDVYNYTSAVPTAGADGSWAVYGEIEIPILRELNLVKDLTLNVSGRYTRYRSYGGQGTYKVTGLYSPSSWLTFRGSYGTSFRAPSLAEQYEGATTGFISGSNDPCNTYDQSGNPTLIKNCSADGLPTGYYNNDGITVINKGGRASGLKAETSKNFNAGTIIQFLTLPKNWGKFKLAVDYYNIKIENGIVQPDVYGILAACYGSGGFRAAGGLCDLVTRDPNSGDLSVVDSYVNLSNSTTNGIDFDLKYERNFGIDKLRIDAILSDYLHQKSQLFSTDPVYDSNGSIGEPKWSGAVDVYYTHRKLTFFYELNWVQHQDSNAYLLAQGYDQSFLDTHDFHTPDYFLHNVSLRYKSDKYIVLVGVDNVFDKSPPSISTDVYNRVGNAPLYSGYDFLGRRFFVDLKRKF